MGQFIIPLLIAFLGFLSIGYTYSAIKRGGARVYSLEREIILRRATSALSIGTLLFIASIALLVYQNWPTPEEPAVLAVPTPAGGATPEVVGTTAFPEIQVESVDTAGSNIPPLITLTPTATIDPNLPTPTATPVIVRAFITGTSGTGLSMRKTPGSAGELMEILPEDTFVTVVDMNETVPQDGFTWIKVRTFVGDEGWVAKEFLAIEGEE
jgi:Bacterial SH3 domain